MTRPLSEFIASIRLIESTEEERCIIADEQAEMRTYIRECEPEMRPRIVAKLIFLHILGENVAYGQMAVLTLMSSDEFGYKKLGYMAAGLILDASSEITVLLTHTIMKDLQSRDIRVQCLALTYLANVNSPEIYQSAITEVQKLMESPNSSVLKRAAMTAVRIVDANPEVADSFRHSVQNLLKHGAHGVVICAIHLVEHMIRADPSLRENYCRYQPAFTKILRQLNMQRPPKEFEYARLNDPFLQLHILRILTIIKRPSEDLDDALEAITTGADIKRNTGRALLLQTVETIVAAAHKQSLRALAFSQIGKLFKFKEANLLYTALSLFSRVLYSGREIVDRTSGDSIALQRYKMDVVQCLNHKDASIRRRALDVVSALIDENNVESLVPEVLDYVKLADKEFRIELVGKVFTAVQRFAPTTKWNFDMALRIITENGSAVANDIITSFCKLIMRTPQIHKYAVAALENTLANNTTNQALIQVSSWVIGEFMVENTNAYENLKKIMLMPQTTAQSKGYIITAISKLAVRFNWKEDALEFMKGLEKANELDIQQRAGELVTLLQSGSICDEVLAPIECEEAYDSQTATLVGVDVGTTESLLDFGDTPQEPKRQDRIADDDDLFLIMQDGPTEQKKQTSGSLRDLIDAIPDSQSIFLDTTAPVEIPKITPFPGSVEGLRKQDYAMYFEIKKNPANPKQMAIRVSIFNLSSSEFTNFGVKFGVPVGWMLQAQAPSATVLEPVGGKPITQQLMLITQTNVPLHMKAQICYNYGSQPIKELGEINPIFD